MPAHQSTYAPFVAYNITGCLVGAISAALFIGWAGGICGYQPAEPAILINMLQLSAAIIGRRVMSLQTSSAVAVTTGVVLDPNNLKIEALRCQESRGSSELLLLPRDIRDIISQGIVVNDHTVLTEAEDLVRLKDVLELGYEIIGKKVLTTDQQKIGRVEDFAIESQSMYIQKLYVTPTFMKSLAGGQRSIDRSQIVEITNSSVIVQDTKERANGAVPVAA